MVGLHNQVRRKAVGLDTGLLDSGGHLLELVQRVAGQQQLRLGGTPLLDNRDGLKPDDRTAADGLVDIAADGVVRRCTLRCGVRTLHRGNAQPVREGDIAHGQGLCQHMGVGCKGQVNTQFCGTLLDFF